MTTLVFTFAAILAAAVTLEGPAPFTADELDRALSVRGAPAGEVAVRSVGLDAVAVRHEGRRRVVPLYGRTGPQAARWVALAVVELAIRSVLML